MRGKEIGGSSERERDEMGMEGVDFLLIRKEGGRVWLGSNRDGFR